MPLQSAACNIYVGRRGEITVFELNRWAELMQGLSKAEYQVAKVNHSSAFSFWSANGLKTLKCTYTDCVPSAINNLSEAISPEEDCQ